MGQFATSTKLWLESALRQRKRLLRIDKSLKNKLAVLIAVERLEKQLSTYSYSNDLNMARFVRAFEGDILTILPGAGSTCHEKRAQQMHLVITRAIQVIEDHERRYVSPSFAWEEPDLFKL